MAGRARACKPSPALMAWAGPQNPPDAGAVLGVHPAGLDFAMNQGELAHQFHRGGGGQGRGVIAGQGFAYGQGQDAGQVQFRRPVLGLAVLVSPAQLIAEHIVEDALPGGEQGPQFPVNRLSVGIGYGCLRYGFT